jgi:hypothetical protein
VALVMDGRPARGWRLPPSLCAFRSGSARSARSWTGLFASIRLAYSYGESFRCSRHQVVVAISRESGLELPRRDLAGRLTPPCSVATTHVGRVACARVAGPSRGSDLNGYQLAHTTRPHKLS